MSKIVNLSVLIDALDFHLDESLVFLNKETGEIVHVLKHYLPMVEDGEDGRNLLPWEKEVFKIAEDIVDHEENYVEIDTQFEVDDYDIMEDFCLAVKNSQVQEQLLSAIRGKGAFRRFKDKIEFFDIEEEWYDYRYHRLKEIAINFCEKNEIDYVNQ